MKPLQTAYNVHNLSLCITFFYFSLPLSPQLLLQSHTNFVNCVRFSPDGNRFVTADADGYVSVELPGMATPPHESFYSKIISCYCVKKMSLMF